MLKIIVSLFITQRPAMQVDPDLANNDCEVIMRYLKSVNSLLHLSLMRKMIDQYANKHCRDHSNYIKLKNEFSAVEGKFFINDTFIYD